MNQYDRLAKEIDEGPCCEWCHRTPVDKAGDICPKCDKRRCLICAKEPISRQVPLATHNVPVGAICFKKFPEWCQTFFDGLRRAYIDPHTELPQEPLDLTAIGRQ